ncbi:hypothetical protein ACROYT_G023923 [Oculina patagonica]
MKDFIVTVFAIVAFGKVGGKGNSSDSKDDQPFKVFIRLKGSSLSYAGRVEVSEDGKVWGTICDKNWNLRDARVICRQLKFSFTEAAVPMAGFGAGSGPIFLKDVKCGGSEQSLLKCKHDGWKSHDVNESCDHSMDAGVVCRPHKETLQLIVFIVVACLLALSYLVNIWFIYYACCKQRRRRKRHLTAVQQRAITRKKLSQEGLENLALDCEGCADLSTTDKRESPVPVRNGIHSTHSGGVSSEDGPTGEAADQQEQQQHVYQRLESCILDPSSQEYLEILESLPETSTNQQTEMCTGGKSSDNQYEKLILRNMPSDTEQASSTEQGLSQTGNTAAEEIPDYVEIIGEDSLAGNAMATSSAATVNVKKRYETLKLAPGPSHGVQGDSASSVVTKDQQSVQAENQEEEDYVELLPENEAGSKESKTIVSAHMENAYEPMNG